MAEGIRFNSESFDDDSSSESNKDAKKKKKKAGNVGKAIVNGVVEGVTPKAEGQSGQKQSIFEQLRGWLSEESLKKDTNKTPEATVFEPKTGRDIEGLAVVSSDEEETAIARAQEMLAAETPTDTTDQPYFESFRRDLTGNELSQGEGIINLHAEQGAENLSDEAIFQRSVERDLSMIETVESDDEERAVARAATILNRTPEDLHGDVEASPAATKPNTSSFGSLLERRLAIESARATGHARGLVEGAVGGAIVAGGLEHGRHSRREKVIAKKLKTEQRKQKNALEELQSTTTRLTEKQEAIARTVSKDRFEYEERLKKEADIAIAARTSEATATAKALAAEKAKADAEKEKVKVIERLNAQAAEQERLATEAQLKNPEHRIETSAWHAMEVDKSGHVVEDSAIEYGHEYYRERAHETGPKDQIDAKAGSAAVAAAMFAAGGDSGSRGTHAQGTPVTSTISPQKSALPPIVGIDSSTDVDGNSSYTNSFAGIIPLIIVLMIIIAALFLLL